MSQVDFHARVALVALVKEKFTEMSTANTCAVAATALLYYDYFLTLSEEVRCVWKGKFTGVTVMFLINRYATILYRTLMVIQLMNWDVYPEEVANEVCMGIIRLNEGLHILIGLTIALFMALRLYAVWSSDRRIFLFVLSLGLVTPAINLYYYTIIHIVATGTPFSGCGEIVNLNAGGAAFFNVFNRVFAMVADAIILILTWVRTVDIMRTFKLRLKTSLGMMLMRDGTVYFVFLLSLNVVNLIANKAKRFGAVPAISDVVTSILISRFLLNLRGVYLADRDVSSSFHPSRLSDVRFAHTLTGNLGAPLELGGSPDKDEDEQPEMEEIFSQDPLIVGIRHLTPKDDTEHEHMNALPFFTKLEGSETVSEDNGSSDDLDDRDSVQFELERSDMV